MRFFKSRAFLRTVICLLAIYIAVDFYIDGMRLDAQTEEDQGILDSHWAQGSNAALSFPADENWFRTNGIYKVLWSQVTEHSSPTQYSTVLRYLGPLAEGTNKLYTLRTHLTPGQVYSIEKTPKGFRYKVIKPSRR